MSAEGLRAVDGLKLPEEYRALLRPGETETDFCGNAHHLPRFFYEISSWQEAHEIRLAPHFTLAELMLVDCREARLLVSQFPHYKAFMPGEQLRTFTVSETPSFPMRNQLRNIGPSRPRSVPLCLFDHSARNERKPTTISTSI